MSSDCISDRWLLSHTGHVDIHDSYAEYEHVVVAVLFVGHFVLAQGKLVVTAHVRIVGEKSHLLRSRGILKRKPTEAVLVEALNV